MVFLADPLGLLSGFLNIVGKIFCLAVPNESGSRGIIYVSVACICSASP